MTRARSVATVCAILVATAVAAACGTPTPTPTPAAVTSPSAPTATPSRSPTVTPAPPTPTPTPVTPSPTATVTPQPPTPTRPPAPTATDTPVPPTSTPAGPQVLTSIAIADGADLSDSRMALDSAAHRLFVTLPDRDSLAVLDVQTQDLTGLASVGPAPRALAADSATGKAYVVNTGHTVAVVDGASLTSTTVDLTFYPQGSAELTDVAVNPTTGHVYVFGDQKKPTAPSAEYVPNPVVLILDASSQQVLAVAQTAGVPGPMALDLQTDRVYTIGYQGFRGGQGVLNEVDGTTGLVKTISLGPGFFAMLQSETARAIVVDPLAQQVYFSLLYGSRLGLAVVDLRTEGVTTLDPPGQASQLIVDAAAGRAYAIVEGAGLLWLVDSNASEAQSVPIGQDLTAMALDATRGRLYLVDAGSDSLWIFDTRAGEVVAMLAVGQGPIAVVADPTNRRAYVLSLDGSVAVVQD